VPGVRAFVWMCGKATGHCPILSEVSALREMATSAGTASEPGKPRRRLKAEERRESILSAANSVFGQHGYEHVRIDDVAAAAGISKALIYEHFRSKQELYCELMSRAANELLERVGAAASAPGVDGPARLEQGTTAGFSFVAEQPEAFQMFVRDVTDPEIAAVQAKLRADYVAMMVRVMELEPPEKQAGLERRQIEQLAEMMVGGWYALADWWLRNRDAEVEELISILLSFMWLGLGRMQLGERWPAQSLGGRLAPETEKDRHGSIDSSNRAA
jgi:AcrR family transcriptional regulator